MGKVLKKCWSKPWSFLSLFKFSGQTVRGLSTNEEQERTRSSTYYMAIHIEWRKENLYCICPT